MRREAVQREAVTREATKSSPVRRASSPAPAAQRCWRAAESAGPDVPRGAWAPAPGRKIRALGLLVLFSLAFISSLSARGVEEQSPYTITTAENSTLGTYLTDSAGNTLYYYTGDIPGVSNCTGGCEAMWPPFNARTISVPSSLNAGNFSYITRNNGRQQVAYRGWPLYYYSRDWAPHDTNGQGLYGTWYVVQPALMGPRESP